MIELIVTSSVLILAIAALRFCLRGRISARLQYGLWALVALRLLLPVSLFESPVSVMNLLPEATVNREALPLTQPVQDAAGSPEQQPDTRVTPEGSSGVALGQLATGIWLGGAALCGLVFLAANLRMSRRLRKSRMPMKMGNRKLAVFTAEGLSSPCLYGLWEPVIYLTPESTTDATRLAHILAHEETHYRHKDHLWALLRVVCVCVHWYNPLVWLAAARSRQDGELACDESTLARLGEENRIAYGKTLIEMMRVPTKPADLLCCATTMRSGKNELAERLRRIAKKPKILMTVVLLTLLVSVTVVAATFGGASKPVENPANISHAEKLWNARTEYVGNAPAVGKLIGLLPVPQGLEYDHFALHTSEEPYIIELVYTTTPTVLARYGEEGASELKNPLHRNALMLLALVEHADGVRATIESGDQAVVFSNDRTWAQEVVGGDVRQFANSAASVAELMELALTGAPDSGSVPANDTFSFSKSAMPSPDSPATQELDDQPATQRPAPSSDGQTASYRSTYFNNKGDEMISLSALTDETLAEEIIMDVLAKSAAWQGVDVATLEEYYLIERTIPATGEKQAYYAYLLDGRAVLQGGKNGMYSYLSDTLYDRLHQRFAMATQRTTDVLHDLTAESPVTLTATELYANSWRTNSETISVAVSGTTLPVVVELYDADSRADLLATFTLNEGKASDTFTNLTAARNYYITAMGDRNAKVTVSDAT